MIFGIIKETKSPVERRAPLTPVQVKELSEHYPEHLFMVEGYRDRCYKNEEYSALGIKLTNDISHSDVLIGIKEVDTDYLLADKTYIFFSHTAKMQPHNRNLFRELARKKITLIDFEYLADESGNRLAAFGRWAGIVGSYNAVRAVNILFRQQDLIPAYSLNNYKNLLKQLSGVKLPALKILITGEGRVGGGAAEVLENSGVKRVNEKAFLESAFKVPVFLQIGPDRYMKHVDGKTFSFSDFIHNPGNYKSDFMKYTWVTDVYIPCHFWDPETGIFFSKSDMQSKEFRIKIIADISCDIPGPVPSSIRTSTVDSPFYGYDPESGRECSPFRDGSITVMAVDNLPSELPRDATYEFGEQFKNIIPELFKASKSDILERGTILEKGKLTSGFQYLSGYLNQD